MIKYDNSKLDNSKISSIQAETNLESFRRKKCKIFKFLKIFKIPKKKLNQYQY